MKLLSNEVKSRREEKGDLGSDKAIKPIKRSLWKTPKEIEHKRDMNDNAL